MRWFFFALGAVGLGVGAAAACSSSPSTDLTDVADSGRRRDTGASEEEDAGFDPNAVDPSVPVVDFDAGVVPDGGDNSSCTGQADGFHPAEAAGPMRCCGQVLVDTSLSGNCGACGITCTENGAATECTRLPSPPAEADQFSCSCTLSAECAKEGYYGAGATCYPMLGVTVCNCQCGTATGTTCAGKCPGGGTCKMQMEHNACSY